MRAAIAIALLSSACGWGPPMSLACQDVARARCTLRDRCSNGVSIITGYGDMTTCLAREQLGCMLSYQLPGANASPRFVEACAEAYGTFGCTELLAGQVPPACLTIGTRAIGAPCAGNGQCASGFCAGTKTANCGQCAPVPVAGAPCVSSGCGNALQCPSRTKICAEIPGPGMPCDSNASPCGDDYACTNDGGSGQPTCQPSSAIVGVPCGGANGACNATRGLTCAGISVETRTCRPFEYLGDGAACGSLPNGTNASCASGACFTDTGVAKIGEEGRCKANAADGEPCDAMLGPSCVSPARCVIGATGTAGVCTLPTPASCG